MSKVGIITLPSYFNFGNRLQCYAMTEAVKKAGADPYVIQRERPGMPLSFPRRVYRKMRRVGKSFLTHQKPVSAMDLMNEGRKAAVKRFELHIPTMVLPGNGYSARDLFDALIVGSDQVWNPNWIGDKEDWLFATFARPEQRFAVSASIGLDGFADARQEKVVAEGVKGFARISMRETRGAQLVRECAGIDAEVTCDPTLVLTAEEWREVADARLTPREPYVFSYILGGVGAEASAVLEEVTDHGRIPVVALSDRQKPGELDAGPAEFIDLVDHASHVVTDSFHGAALGSIFQTPLTIVHREGATGMFSRLEQLSQVLGIQEKVYGSSAFDLGKAGDYDGVPEAIARERAKFMEYLEGCLNA